MEDKIMSLTGTKPKQRWSKSVTANGVTQSVNVEEVMNGFIIRVSKYGTPINKKDAKYIDVEEVYISKENPLKDNTPDEKEDDFTLGNIDATLSSMLGGLTI